MNETHIVLQAGSRNFQDQVPVLISKLEFRAMQHQALIALHLTPRKAEWTTGKKNVSRS